MPQSTDVDESIRAALTLIKGTKADIDQNKGLRISKATNTVRMVRNVAKELDPVLDVTLSPPSQVDEEKYDLIAQVYILKISALGNDIVSWEIDATGKKDPVVLTRERVKKAIDDGLQRLLKAKETPPLPRIPRALPDLPSGLQLTKSFYIGDLSVTEFAPGAKESRLTIIAEPSLIEALHKVCGRTKGVFTAANVTRNDGWTSALELVISPLADARNVGILLTEYLTRVTKKG